MSPEKLRRSTFWTLLVGYGAYYLCRANLGVAVPLLKDELHLDKPALGRITFVSTLAYAVGKFTLGPTADRLGGRRVFLLGLAVSIAANVAFGLSAGLGALVVVWSVNRFAQSAGWMGLVQLVSGWYEQRDYGLVMAWLSLSFLLGDVAARGFGGVVLALGFGWRALFFAPAIVCALFLLIASRTLEARPTTRPAIEDSVERGASEPSFRDILALLVKSRGFWTACVLSLLLTFLRTAFLDWTGLYFADSGASEWSAALQSAAFPAAGVAGTL
ncbi:MAG TPA: MFS transporter, partial [Byssovorax sp.]